MKILIKIISLSLIFALVFNFASAYLTDNIDNNYSYENGNNSDENENKKGNKYNFKKSNTIILGNIGVALSTNVGIKYKQRQENNLYKNVPNIGNIISEKKFANTSESTKHINKIREYHNILKTDIKKLVSKSYNRRATLEAYIEQLKYRYNNSNIQMRELVKKKQSLSADMKKSSEKINFYKKNIDKNFRIYNAKGVDENIVNLLNEKSKYNYARTYIILVNQYIKQYSNLNSANKKLLDTLINNKKAIIQNSQIVIPNTGITALKKLDLIIDEKEFKKTK